VVTLFDVARLAGVSTATVSRVVHGQDRVREATRIRVQQAIEELGYVPDGAAQSLSRRRKEIIGMVALGEVHAGLWRLPAAAGARPGHQRQRPLLRAPDA
jgi:DNA-binding LacI/PurR family transcriptional regulator